MVRHSHIGVVVVSVIFLFSQFAIYPTLSLPVQANEPALRYVASTTGNDHHNDCRSPVSPCRTIQHAINQSQFGDTILVAAGTYTYNLGVDSCPFLQTRAVVCFVDKRLNIWGGYSTTNWFTSDPVRNPTIIDGQSTYRGVAVIGYNTLTSHLDMRGFIIQNCRAQGPTYLNPYDPSGVGGGMLVQHASVALTDMVFRNNKAIGQNTSAGAGGQADGAALRIEEPPAGTLSVLRRVRFENNESYGGSGPVRGGVAFGALFIYKANVLIEDAAFVNNVAKAGDSSGNGLFGDLTADALGGGIAVEEGFIVLQRVTVTNNRVQGGNAQQSGGKALGGGIFIEDFGNRATSVIIRDSYVANNIAIGGSGVSGGNAAGGGICVDSSNITTIERTTIFSNSVLGGNSTTNGTPGPGAGGGLYIFAVREGSFQSILKNIIVAQNFANQGQGTVHPGNGGGGGIVIHGVNADIAHATIAYNRLGPALVLGQGLLVQPWPSPTETDIQFRAVVALNNSVIAHHTSGSSSAAAIVVQRGSELTFNHGLFAGNNKNINTDNSPVPAGTINGLNTMVSASSVKFIAPDPPHYNYHLRKDSAAVDRSTVSNVADDIDHQSRPYNNQFDFGADEYHPFPIAVSPGDGFIRLDWTTGARIFSGGVSRYGISVTCETGANPPSETGCGTEINLGSVTTITLTGLTNFKRYTVEVRAYDGANTEIATSARVTSFPTNLFVFLPLVLR